MELLIYALARMHHSESICPSGSNIAEVEFGHISGLSLDPAPPYTADKLRLEN